MQVDLQTIPGYMVARSSTANEQRARLSNYFESITPVVSANNFERGEEFRREVRQMHLNALTLALAKNVFPCVILEEDAHPTKWHSSVVDVPDDADVFKLDHNRKPVKACQPSSPYVSTTIDDLYLLNQDFSAAAFVIMRRDVAEKLKDVAERLPLLPIDDAFCRVMPAMKWYANNYPRFYHGPLSNRGAPITLQPLVDNRISVSSLDIHIVHSCNLACKQCCHFSDQITGKPIPRDEVLAGVEAWYDKISPKYIAILGGEPALNPDLASIIYNTRAYFPDTRLIVVTNGFLVDRHPKLKFALINNNCEIHVSLHHHSKEYKQKLAPNLAMLREWQKRGVKLLVRDSHSEWRATLPAGPDGRYVPYQDNRPRASWDICMSKTCLQLFRGKIWKCPQIAYLQLLAEQKKIDSHVWEKYLAYKPLDPSATKSEMLEFFARQDESICNMCASNVIQVKIPNPMRGTASNEANEANE